MILNEMTTLDIEFGDTEGKREFNNSANILNMFFKDEYKDYLEDFITGKLRYIYGLKGTGKTSLLKYLEDVAISKEIETMYISYKDFKEEADVIHEFRNELSNSNDQDTYTLTFWRWYLLSLISKNFLNESKYDINNLIYHSKVKFFRLLSNILDVITEVNIGNNATNVNVKFCAGNFNVKWDGQTADRIRQLETNIKEGLEKKVIIFIDELEISKFSSTYDVDAVLVKNLIRATRKINDLNLNLHIVLAVRSEVVNSIAVAGDEINKELEDFGFEIEWHRRKFDIEHPLIMMFIQKIRYSMKQYASKQTNSTHLTNEVERMSNSDIWYRWFPKYISNTSTPEFILQNTWLKPRDLSRLFRTMKRYNNNANMFTQFSYEEAIKKVGEDSWKEIQEELSSIYTPLIMGSVKDVLETMQILFLKDDFLKEAKKKSINEEDAVKILQDLYRVSAIGNSYKTRKYNQLRSIYRFSYRNDKQLYEDRAIIVHKAIEKGLGLSDFNEKLLTQHLSEEDKKIYLDNNNDTYKNEGFFSLKDKLREVRPK